jgi:hypothetical protein
VALNTELMATITTTYHDGSRGTAHVVGGPAAIANHIAGDLKWADLRRPPVYTITLSSPPKKL